METQVDRTFRFSHGLGIAAGIAAKILKAFFAVCGGAVGNPHLTPVAQFVTLEDRGDRFQRGSDGSKSPSDASS